ncbi:succinyl-diaminopimelate desuccinylase [Rickettsia endosymbiont of Halotydeus destructor]|uniref:succinyl-diaminopimelate desuccinylase n=1 Tax=Rickettsia endosymbiont of Halotydeus destructor TaxID=2996754 RepID=UPI003BAE98F3
MHISYFKKLISFESVTPNSAGAIEYIEKLLQESGFQTEIKIFGDSESEQVTNLYAVYGTNKPNICFVGHVDVVPAGDAALWHASPFLAHIIDDKIYGRGAVDMKGSIACFLAASLDFIKSNPKLNGSISFLITSDEEGEAKYGTKEMLKHIYSQGHKIDFAIVGEPTNEEEIGDTIKIGRRGSVNFNLNIQGKEGHVAYPHKANNPLPCLIKILNELTNIKLDEGTEFFQSSNLEMTNINVGNNTSNVIPASTEAHFNIRFNNLHSAKILAQLVEEIIKRYCEKYKVDYKLEYSSSSDSFIQNPNNAIKEFADIVERTLKIKPEFSTSGGTSDARFVKDYCSVVEFGLLSEMAHKINECTKITDLQKLYDVYYNSLRKFLA